MNQQIIENRSNILYESNGNQDIETVQVDNQPTTQMDNKEQHTANKQNNVWQHIVLFFLVSTTSGCVFTWLVLEEHIFQHGYPGVKYKGTGFLTCVFTFIGTGTLLHFRLLSLLVRKPGFMPSFYIAISLFLIGLICTVIGTLYVPELLFVAEILLSLTGSYLYVSQFLLWDCYKNHAVIMSCAFAVSTLVILAVDLSWPYYATFIVWGIVVLLLAILYRPKMPNPLMAYSGTCQGIKDVFKHKKLYPVYIDVLAGVTAKIYYQNGFYTRIYAFHDYTYVNSVPINTIYTISNFSAIIAGIFNLMPLYWAHMLNMVMSMVFNVLVLSTQSLIVQCLNLFLMNISSTGYITATLSLCVQETNLMESDTLVYIAMCLGDIFGIISDKLKDDNNIRLMDYAVIIPCLLIQGICSISFLWVWKEQLYKKRSK